LSVSAEIATLAGVALGAVLSFSATYIADRTSWLRGQAVRWDERRLTAYADYSYAVKDMVALAARLAAGRGLDTSFEPLDSSQDSLVKLAEAGVRRTMASETLRLLADEDAMVAAGEMTRSATELEWLARGKTQGDSSDWHRAYARYEEARDQYTRCARKSLKITGSRIAANPRPQSSNLPANEAIAASQRPHEN